MLKPFWMLEGNINQVKEIDSKEIKEIWYEDESGNKAIVIQQKNKAKPKA